MQDYIEVLPKIRRLMPVEWTHMEDMNWERFHASLKSLGVKIEMRQLPEFLRNLEAEFVLEKDGHMFRKHQTGKKPDRSDGRNLASPFDKSIDEIAVVCNQWAEAKGKRGKEFRVISMIQELVDKANTQR